MRRILLTAFLIALGLTGPASATRVLYQPEDAYELSLGDVGMPKHVGDAVIFKPCPECKAVGLRVTAETRYFVSGQQVALEELAELAAALGRSTHVAVFFDKESRLVNRITIY